jgi:hypothetical protein
VTDERPPEVAEVVRQVTPDDLVEQTLERAADKVASAGGVADGAVMNRTEALVSVALVVLLELAGLFVVVTTRSEMRQHREDFSEVCQLIVNQAPPEKAVELARQLSRCVQ